MTYAKVKLKKIKLKMKHKTENTLYNYGNSGIDLFYTFDTFVLSVVTVEDV